MRTVLCQDRKIIIKHDGRWDDSNFPDFDLQKINTWYVEVHKIKAYIQIKIKLEKIHKMVVFFVNFTKWLIFFGHFYSEFTY